MTLITSHDQMRASSILPAIAAQIAGNPTATAVVFDAQRRSYRELGICSDRIAAALAGTAQTHIGIYMSRCLELPEALLGVMKAGAAYVPLDPEYPPERLQSMIADAGIDTVLINGTASPLTGVRTIDLSCPLPSGAEPREIFGADALAYTIYTSGSTGRPKGAMNTHAGLLNRLQWMQSAYLLQPSDRVLQKTPFTFDVSVWEFFWPMLTGASQVLAIPGGHRDFGYLADLMVQAGITRVHFVPSMLDGFLLATHGREFPELRQIVCSGEALPTPLAERVFARYPNVRLDNLYGPTEAAIDVSFHACSSGESAPGQPIGRAIDGVDLPVLDSWLQPAPVGTVGELFIGGVALARGYVGRPGLTAERFLPHPAGVGARMYRTGDLVQARDDGTLDYLGRTDFQVKINGQRIELGEIENRLRTHPDIASTLVVDRVGPGGRKLLVAYLTLADKALLRRAAVEQQALAWREMYDSIYGDLDGTGGSASDNFLSWNDSYDGTPLGIEDMRRWADDAVAHIVAGAPSRVLEVGCGSGLMALRLLEHVTTYIGIDPSPAAVDYLLRKIPPGVRSKARLAPGFAHDLPEMDVMVDSVVLNSVIQYFPDRGYLADVLEQCLLRVRNGRIFIGDVRDYRLLDVFCTSIERFRANDNDSIGTLRKRSALRRDQETELLVDPRWFLNWSAAHARITACELIPKSTDYDNELSRYRYDVILHVDRVPAPVLLSHQFDGATPAVLEELASLRCESGMFIEVRNVPFPPLGAEMALQHRLDAAADDVTIGSISSRTLAPASRFGALPLLSGFRMLYRLDPDRPGMSIVTYVPEARAQVVLPAVASWGAPNAAIDLANAPLRKNLSQRASDELKPYLSQTLPAFMLPERFCVLDRIPLTSSGKVDRSALPSPFRSEHALDGSARAPSNETEAKLQEIWAELLNCETVPLDRTLYELGGDSISVALMAIQAVARGIPLTLSIAHGNATIESLAVLMHQPNTVAIPDALSQQPGQSQLQPPANSTYSDSELQRLLRTAQRGGTPAPRVEPLGEWIAGMLVESIQQPGRGINYELVEIELNDMDEVAFRHAWSDVAARHEWLRSGFSFLFADRPARLIFESVDVPTSSYNWRDLDSAEQTRHWDELCSRCWSQAFTVEQAPLMHIHLARLDEKRTRVAWVLHHATTDGWSYALVLSDWALAYRARCAGLAPQWSTATPEYSRFSAWQARNERSPHVIDYWRDYLKGLNAGAGSLPAGRARTMSNGVVRRVLHLVPAQVQALEHHARAQGCTVSSVVELLWGQQLAHWLGMAEVCIGCMFSLRAPEIIGIESLVGPMLTVLPVRVAAACPEQPLLLQAREHLQRRSGHSAHAAVHPGVLRAASPKVGAAPLFDSVVVFENMPAVESENVFARISFNSRTAKPLVLMIWPGLHYRIELYMDSARVDTEDAALLLGAVVANLLRIGRDADANPSNLGGPGAANPMRPVDEVVEFSL